MSCTISSGDMPIEIQWKKDGETFDPPTDIQVNPLPLRLPASIVLRTDSIVLRALRPLGIALSVGCHQVQNNVFSSNILFFSLRASHSGSYTCIATNKAAAVNFTAQLIVRGELFFLFSAAFLYLLSLPSLDGFFRSFSKVGTRASGSDHSSQGELYVQIPRYENQSSVTEYSNIHF